MVISLLSRVPYALLLKVVSCGPTERKQLQCSVLWSKELVHYECN